MTEPARGVHGLPPVSAQLSVRNGRAALDFYRAAFAADPVFCLPGDREGDVALAQLAVGDAVFWFAEESPEHRNFSPESLGGSTVRMLLVSPDPQSLIDRAVAAGARLDYAAKEDYGWLLGRIQDPFGHIWEIGTPVMPWPPSF